MLQIPAFLIEGFAALVEVLPLLVQMLLEGLLLLTGEFLGGEKFLGRRGDHAGLFGLLGILRGLGVEAVPGEFQQPLVGR